MVIVPVKVWVPIKRGQKAWCVDSRITHVVGACFDEKDIVGGVFTQSVCHDEAADTHTLIRKLQIILGYKMALYGIYELGTLYPIKLASYSITR